MPIDVEEDMSHLCSETAGADETDDMVEEALGLLEQEGTGAADDDGSVAPQASDAGAQILHPFSGVSGRERFFEYYYSVAVDTMFAIV